MYAGAVNVPLNFRCDTPCTIPVGKREKEGKEGRGRGKSREGAKMNYQMLQQALGGQLGGAAMPGAQVRGHYTLRMRAILAHRMLSTRTHTHSHAFD